MSFTTSDVDFLYEHFRKPNADTGRDDIHIRLVNPVSAELFDAITSVSRRLDERHREPDWAGGCIHLIYAGHGEQVGGALVLRDRAISAEEFVRHVVANVSTTQGRRRLDVVLDSCYSAAFMVGLLVEAINLHGAKIFPCSLFAAALHDELAWEYPRYRHGIWTAAFSQQLRTPSLSSPRWMLLARVLWRRILKAEAKELYNGGVPYMTGGMQHSFLYENGDFGVDGRGSFHLPDSKEVDPVELKRLLEEARTRVQ